MKTVKASSYLIKNPYSYCFRMTVPKDLQGKLSKRELRYSLKTGNLSEAKIKARIMAGKVQLLFIQLKRGSSISMKLSAEKINTMIKTYRDQLIQQYNEPATFNRYVEPEDYHQFANDADALEGTLEILPDIKRDFQKKRFVGDYSDISPEADRLLTEAGINQDEIDKSSKAYAKLCSGLLDAEIEGIDYQMKMLSGTSENISSVENIKPLKVSSEDTSISIQQVIDKYFEHGDAEGTWRDEEIRNVTKASMEMLADYFGNAPMNTITPEMMGEYKLDLFKLPKHRGNGTAYEGKSISEILNMEKDEKTIGSSTVTKHIKRAKTLFKFAVDTRKIDFNPAAWITIKKTKRADEERDLFTKEELQKIFGSELFVKDKFKKPYQLWMPLLLLYTGARREEICQLQLNDFEEHQGILCININTFDDKDVKTPAGKRIVPLHPFLTEEMNVFKRVEQLRRLRKKRFFPEINPYKGKYGFNPGRWFRTFKEKLGFPVGEGKDLHSFRHTFTDNLKQQLVNPDVIEEITGHVLQGEGMGRYGKRFKPNVLYNEAILKLDYGIDLSHLKNSKYFPR